MNLKVAILVDDLTNRGGIQRAVLSMAKIFNADIYAGKYSPNKTFKGFSKFRITVLNKLNLSQRVDKLYLNYKYKFLKLDKYDIYILLGGASLNSAKANRPNLWWCCSPRIWLYHTTDTDLKRVSFLKRMLIYCLLPFLRLEDKLNVKNVQNIKSIAKNVRFRVKKIYDRDSEIIYPFVDLNKFKYLKSGDYYLSSARLTSDKKVDLIVEAFKLMPDKKLIIASGGSELENIKKISQNYKNIKVLGYVSDKKLSKLYGDCIATIATSYYEDFGMIAIESMAAGKPVIASNDMGFRESVIHGKTGYLIDPKITEIIKYVNILDKKSSISMRKNCEKRAEQFSEDIFIKKFKKTVKEIIDENKKLSKR
tara:strand:+ start:277 stop:1374 length:1098 start_codon:yes stop_codon:yes gene_type:complete